MPLYQGIPIFGTVLGVGSLAAYASSVWRRRRADELEATPVRPLSQLVAHLQDPSIVQEAIYCCVRGAIDCDHEPLKTKVADVEQQCVVRRIDSLRVVEEQTVEEVTGSSKKGKKTVAKFEKKNELLNRDQKQLPFYVADGSGARARILIDVDQLPLQRVGYDFQPGHGGGGGNVTVNTGSNVVQTGALQKVTLGYTTEEYIMPIGTNQPLLIWGELRITDEGPSLTPPSRLSKSKRPFVVTFESRSEIIDSEYREAHGWRVAAITLVVAALLVSVVEIRRGK